MRPLAVDDQTARHRLAEPVKLQELVALEHQQQLGDVGGEIDAVHLAGAGFRSGAGIGDPADGGGDPPALTVEPGHGAAERLAFVARRMRCAQHAAQMG
jgi:hypothetical protein